LWVCDTFCSYAIRLEIARDDCIRPDSVLSEFDCKDSGQLLQSIRYDTSRGVKEILLLQPEIINDLITSVKCFIIYDKPRRYSSNCRTYMEKLLQQK
jgi:hypothetical protein